MTTDVSARELNYNSNMDSIKASEVGDELDPCRTSFQLSPTNTPT